MQKKRKSWLSMLLACSMCVSLLPTTGLAVNAEAAIGENALIESAAVDTAQNNLRMWYKQPVRNWETDSMVIGNGFMGSMPYGGVAKDQIHFNDKTLWTGGPNPNTPNGYNGGNRSTAVTAQELANVRADLEANFRNDQSGVGSMMGSGSGLGSYQDFGDIYVDFAPAGHTEALASNYERDLDLNTAIASTKYDFGGASYLRQYFTSFPDKVQVYRYSASQLGKQSFNVSMACRQAGSTCVAQGDTITLTGKIAGNDLKYEAQMRVLVDGGTYAAQPDGSIQVRDADTVTLIMASGTDYKNVYPTYRGADPHAEITSNISKAAAKGFAKLRDAHVADYSALFSRVSLDIGSLPTDIPTDELIKNYRKGNFDSALDVLVFQFGRYLTIAGTRTGSLPTNLVGMWGEGDANNNMQWNGDYHFNVNVQMNYWPTYSTNLEECGKPFAEYMNSLREPGRVSAGMSHNIHSAPGEENGWIVHTQNNPFGMTAPAGSQEYGWNPGGAPWALQNMYDEYRFTGDKEYLRTTIYPTMREQAKFWDSYLIKSPRQGNRWVVSPSVSPEHGPTVAGCTYDQSLVWQLYKETLEASEILGVDAELRAGWTDKMNGLNPIQIGADGQIKEWYEETHIGKVQVGNAEQNVVNPDSGGADVHRHASHLIGLYPGTIINKDTPETMAAAKVSLEQRGFEITTGWSKGHRVNLWARTMDGNKTYRMVQAFLTQDHRGIMNNLLDSHGAHGGPLGSAGQIFQIEGNYGYTAGVAEMLLQSQLGYIQPLPALPDAWPSGSVKGLVARGNFVCDMDWKNEALTNMKITSGAGETCVVEYKGIGNATITNASGAAITPTKLSNNKVSFPTSKGAAYTVTNIPDAAKITLQTPANVRAYRTAGNKIQLAWDAVAGATGYTVHREKLKTVASGQSTGSVYGEGYTDTYNVASGTEYTDSNVDANSICYYMVSAQKADGTSSPSVPVAVQSLVFTDLIAEANTLLGSMTDPAFAQLKADLQAKVDAANAVTDTTPLLTREAAYQALQAMNAKCKSALTLPELLVTARKALEEAVPGTQSWNCDQTLYNDLNGAEQNCRVLLEVGVQAYSAEQIAAMAQALKTATQAVQGEQSKMTLTITPNKQSLAVGDKVMIQTAVNDPAFTVHYTLDGTAPTASSPLYSGALTATTAGSASVQAQLFRAGAPVGTRAARVYVNEGATTNLALNKTVTSSTDNWGGGFTAAAAADGNMNTRWASKMAPTSAAGADIIVNLGQAMDVGRVSLYEATGESMGVRLHGFKIQTGTSATGPWTDVYTGTEVTDKPHCDFVTAHTQFVRFVTTSVTNEVTLKEMEIYAPGPAATLVSQTTATIETGKNALLAGESVLVRAQAWNAAGAPVASSGITYHSTAAADVASWNGATLTLLKAAAPFEIWAECTVDGTVYTTQHKKISARGANVALGATATAAYTRADGQDMRASYAIDGALSSRWDTYGNPSATMPPNLWYQIDFGAVTDFSQVVLDEFANYEVGLTSDLQTMSGFRLETSNNAVDWSPIFTLTPGATPAGYVLTPLDFSGGAGYGTPIADVSGAPICKCIVDSAKKPLTATHTVTLDHLVSAQYLRLVVTNTLAGASNANVSLHEFAVRDAIGGTQKTADMPYASVPSGSFTGSTSVTLTAPDAGAAIYYTTDGSEPTSASTPYTGAIAINANTVLRAVSVVSGMNNSRVARYEYTKTESAGGEVTVSTPTATPAAGTYTTMQTVTLFGGNGANIRYTLDGSVPSATSGTYYTGPIKLAASKTLKAIAYSGANTSTVAEFAYVITVTQPPVFITGLTLSATAIDMAIAETQKLTATVQPAEANQNVTWSSSDSAVASVDASGNVTAHAMGKAVITAITAGGEKTATCFANVTQSARKTFAELTEAIAAAETLKNAVVVSETGADVPASKKWAHAADMNAFVAAIASARTITDASSGAAITVAYDSLASAVAAFNRACTVGTKVLITVTSANTNLGTVAMKTPEGAAISDPKTVQVNDLVKLYAAPKANQRFVKWVNKTAGGAGTPSMDTFAFEGGKAEYTANPLILRASEAIVLEAEFAALETVAANSPALEMLDASVTPENAMRNTGKPVTLVGENGTEGFQSAADTAKVKNYHLYLLTGETSVKLTPWFNSAKNKVTIDGTEVAIASGHTGAQTTVANVTDGQIITISVSDKTAPATKTDYKVTVHKAAADPKMRVQLRQDSSVGTMVTGTLMVSSADFTAAQFEVKIGTGNPSAFTEFTDVNGIALTAESAKTAGFTLSADAAKLLKLTAVAYNPTTKVFSVSVDTGSRDAVSVSEGTPFEIGTFYLKKDAATSLENLWKSLQVTEKAANMNTMTDRRYYGLRDDGQNARATSLVYVMQEENIRVYSYINAAPGANHARITFDVFHYNTATSAIDGTAINGSTKVALTADGLLQYALPAGDYVVKIYAGGYLTHVGKPFKIVSTGEPDFSIGGLTLVAGDVIADAKIDTNDRTALLSVYNQTAVGGAVNTVYADFDDDGRVNAIDLGRLLLNYTK